jgi:F420-non-reducing hydrogenase iron-sulfur subunit
MTLKRITFLQDLLAFMGLEGRLHLAWISSAEAQKFVQVITEFTDKIRSLGPNPLVGASGSGLRHPTHLITQQPAVERPTATSQAEEAIHEIKSQTLA